MKYCLKDHARQEALEKALPQFTSKLQEACNGTPYKRRESLLVQNNDPEFFLCWQVQIPSSEIEAFAEYDPSKWNPWPEVIPPEGVMMRVECANGNKYAQIYRRFEKDGTYGWAWQDGTRMANSAVEQIVRFRPWEDEK